MEITMTLAKLPDIAKELLQRCSLDVSDYATVLALSGELGSGKTTLTQQIARQLGIQENIISPTFVLMKHYPITYNSFKQLIHIDAYRLHKSEELLRLGWQELLDDKHTLIIIEWPEQVPECIPENAIQIKLSHVDENTRKIEIDS